MELAGAGIGGIPSCSLDPAQVFILANSGTVTLTSIAQAVLAGLNTADHAKVAPGQTFGKTGFVALAYNAS